MRPPPGDELVEKAVQYAANARAPRAQDCAVSSEVHRKASSVHRCSSFSCWMGSIMRLPSANVSFEDRLTARRGSVKNKERRRKGTAYSRLALVVSKPAGDRIEVAECEGLRDVVVERSSLLRWCNVALRLCLLLSLSGGAPSRCGVDGERKGGGTERMGSKRTEECLEGLHNRAGGQHS